MAEKTTKEKREFKFLLEYPRRALLDVSTAHVPSSMAMEVWTLEALSPLVAKFEEGVLIRVPYECMVEGIMQPETPEWLVAIYQKAFDMGCEFVLLDADAHIHEDLQQYEW